MCSHCGIEVDTDIDVDSEDDMDQNEITTRLRAIVTETGSQREAAIKLGISPSYLGELLRGTRSPGPLVLRALGLKREIVITEETPT